MLGIPWPAVPLERQIWLVRGRRVMLDADLARVYGVLTKRLNEQVSRNPGRFPPDFMFRLTMWEAKCLPGSRSQSATLKGSQPMRSQVATASRRNERFLPYAFTEHGAVMLASVLNSPRAVQASVEVVRAFIRLRELVASNKRLATRLERLERQVGAQGEAIQRILEAIEGLRERPPEPPRRIGFQP